MKCPVCGCGSRVLESREAANYTTRRRRECIVGHRFTTVEAHSSAVHSSIIARSARAVGARIATLRRDIAVAETLHEQRGKKNVLGKRYGVDAASIYRMARRGRAFLERHRQATARGEA